MFLWQMQVGLGVIDGNIIGFFDCVFSNMSMMDGPSFLVEGIWSKCPAVELHWTQCAPSHLELVQNLKVKWR